MVQDVDRIEFLRLEARGGHIRLLRPNAKLLASDGGEPLPMVARSLKVGDYMAIRYGGYSWPTTAAPLPRLPDRKLYGSEKAVTFPESMTHELAFLLGAYGAEGHTTRSNWTVVVTNSVDDVLERVQAAWSSIFGLTAHITRRTDRCPGVVVSSKRLVEFLEFLELLGCGARAAEKRVPDVVMGSTREHVLGFLQGFALDAYTTHGVAGKWGICLESAAAIDGLQELCRRLGIVSAQIPKHNRQNGKTYFELYAAGPWGQEMSRLVPFLEPDKEASARDYRRRQYTGISAADVIPGLPGPELYSLIPRGRSGRNGRGTGRQQFRYLQDKRTQHVSRAGIEKVRDTGVKLPHWVEEVLDQSIHFVPLVSIETLDLEQATSKPECWLLDAAEIYGGRV